MDNNEFVYIEPDEATLAEWARMTDENRHTEVAWNIAKRFGDGWRGRYFEWRMAINRMRDDERWSERKTPTEVRKFFGCSLTVDNDVVDGMLGDIRERYGQETYEKVLKCL